jgi:hypothetical protein
MRDQTLILHAGFDADPATSAVAVAQERVAARGNFPQGMR